MPTSKARPKQFTLTFSDDEKKKLEKLAEWTGRSQANFLRKIINDAYGAGETKKKPERA